MANNLKHPWWQYSIEHIEQVLGTNVKNGLGDEEAKERLLEFGFNVLPTQKRVSIIGLFLRQFSSIIVWVLIGALVITALLGQWVDTLAIAVIVLLNAIIGFVQEYSAERSLDALKKLTVPLTRVIRNGLVSKVPSRMLVPGDVILLEAGDRVPADGRVTYAAQLATQEAALTGESLSVTKITKIITEKQLPIGDRKNMCFMGTIVVSGKGRMIVTATGSSTELGGIASLLQTTEEQETPLQAQLHQLGKYLVFICFVIIVIIFIIGLFRSYSFFSTLLISLSLAVAAIPEGLPAVLSITLALGVRRMAKRNAIIRHLSAVETLGCASVICTDKTGTLTRSTMVVQRIWVGGSFIEVSGTGYIPEGDFTIKNTRIDPQENKDLMMSLVTSVLSSDAYLQKDESGWSVLGDPTEGALIVAARKAGVEREKIERASKLVSEIPFDPTRKRMSKVWDTSQGRLLYIKGACGAIVQRSKRILIDGIEKNITAEDKERILEANREMGHQALRVLAVAYRKIDSDIDATDISLEEDLVFVGLLGMIDPPRPEAQQAIAACKKAGIAVVMITGDNKETALAIARELHLLKSDSLAVVGSELDRMSDNQLSEKVKQIAVYARTSAEQKLRIVRAWKSHGDIVAMTGDGVNDAPAIKAADIGIAMGITGTEVTQEASDMIITDDNFASIVNAIEEGRGIYDNILKFVNYLVSSNIAELLVIFIGMFIGFTDVHGNPYISLLPVQLLWINLITDGLPAIALGLDPINPNVLQRPPRKPSAPILPWPLIAQLFFISFGIAIGTIIACHIGLAHNAVHGHTMAFTTLVVLEFVRIQMIRGSSHVGLFSNWWVIGALCGSLALQLGVIYIPSLQGIFGTTGLGIIEWVVIVVIAVGVWIVTNIIQLIFKKMHLIES